VEWGYNRDKEQLAQINICLHSGSLKDVSTLKTTLAKMNSVSEGKPTLVVMDKGFFSTGNINAILGMTQPIYGSSLLSHSLPALQKSTTLDKNAPAYLA
jgi:transposase